MLPFDLASVLATVQLLGADSAAYRALFDQVLTLFGQKDQDALKEALAEAIERSDSLHQSIAGGD